MKIYFILTENINKITPKNVSQFKLFDKISLAKELFIDDPSPGRLGGGHSHTSLVQVCAAVKTPFFVMTRA